MKRYAKLDELIAESLYPVTSSANDYDGRSEGSGSNFGGLSIKNGVTVVDKHVDVHEEEGYITIPCSNSLLFFLITLLCIFCCIK